jgi:hypothetical protein
MLAASAQLDGIAGEPAALLGVVATATDHPDVVGQGQAVFLNERPQRLPGHRLAPAQLVAPIAAAVAGDRLVLETAYRTEAADADTLRAEQHVLAFLAVDQAVETERLAP